MGTKLGVWVLLGSGIGLYLILLCSCEPNTKIVSDDRIDLPEGQFLTPDFKVANSLTGRGSAFFLSSIYDGKANKNYIYKMNDHLPISVVKYEMDSSYTLLSTDTLMYRTHLHSSNGKPLVFYTIGVDSFVVIESSEVGQDRLHFLYGQNAIRITRFDSLYNGQQISPTFLSSKNQILSDQYIETCYPVYYHDAKIPESFCQPNFLYKSDSLKTRGLWPVEKRPSNLNPISYDILRIGFSIHTKDRIYHLDRDGREVEVFFPLSGVLNKIPLPIPAFQDPLYKNLDKSLVEVFTESDYWTHFIYNTYKKEYYLVQHIGLPYYNTDGITKRMIDQNEITSILYRLDKDFNLIQTYNIPRERQFSTVLPIFPTSEGLMVQHLIRRNQTGYSIRLKHITL